MRYPDAIEYIKERRRRVSIGGDSGGGMPGDALWRFSLGFYARRGVAEAFLDLQDRHGKDVNLLLYALWHGLSGRGRLTEAGLETADAAIAAPRRDLIQPLRALRRATKGEDGAGAVHAALKTAELEAERLAQVRLAALAPPVTVANPAARIADAEANLGLYLGNLPADAVRAALREQAEGS